MILSGRPREVHRLSKEAINSKGGFGEQEFWSKLSADGKVLYSTPQIEEVLGYTAEEVGEFNFLVACPALVQKQKLIYILFSWHLDRTT